MMQRSIRSAGESKARSAAFTLLELIIATSYPAGSDDHGDSAGAAHHPAGERTQAAR